MNDALVLSVNYGDVVRRRLSVGLAVGVLLAFVTAALALGLPSYYRSRAVILIEQQEIPQDLVRSLVTSFADQRVQVISQRVLTNSNLTEIIRKYGLYSRERARDPLELVLERMRDDISILPISAEVVDPKQGKSVPATIAFELAYENKSPELAQRVASEIVSLFLNENLKQRSQTSNETVKFLSAESDKLRAEVSELESKLAEFKEGNVEQLPENTALNLEMRGRTENDIAQLNSQLRSLEQQRVYLETELAQQKPNTLLFSESGERILGPADRLKVLESEFIPLAARYGATHPDVIAKKREIESLRAQTNSSTSKSEIALRLQKAENALAEARQKYSADHPDIRKLVRETEALRAELASSKDASGVQLPPEEQADNPTYMQLKVRLEATRMEVESVRAQISSMKTKLAELESRITKSPQVEREYRMLTRDYDTAQRKYQEVLAKRQEAELATNLESNQQGERFTLVEPPVVPEEPTSPNRTAIGLLGALISLAGATGAGALAESLDGRIYGRSGVTRLLGVPPLAIIPEMQTEESRAKTRRARQIAVALFLLALLLLGLTIHFFFRPLDVLFYQGVRVIQSL